MLPAFVKDRIDLWFILVEAEFKASRIRSDDTKYNLVIRSLDAETIQRITDILYKPPEKDKYETLKQTLLKRISDSREQQLHKLLKEMVLAERKPSQLLREMRDLAAGAVNDDLLHQLWLDRMPAYIRPLLVTSEKLNLSALSEMADRILEVSNNSYSLATQTVSRIDTMANSKSLEKKIDEMQQLLVQCLHEIKELKLQQQVRQQQLQQVQQQQLQQHQTHQQQVQQ